MEYTVTYDSPLGTLLCAAEEESITRLSFLEKDAVFGAAGWLPVFMEAKRWLDVYFAGENPGKPPKLAPMGTPFQKSVWDMLLTVPYGVTVTYGSIAQRLGKANRASRAVGDAVGRNPIAIMIPCHRVIGADGTLTGYAGGLDRKKKLLLLERGRWM